MPTRTVYVKEEHQKLWDRAKELVGDESLSEIVAEGLQRVIQAREALQAGFERVKLDIAKPGETWRTIAFQGREIAEHGNFTAYLRKNGRILIYQNCSYDGFAEYREYNNVSEADAEEGNNHERFYPPELLSEIAEEIGEEYVHDLDLCEEG